MMIIDYRECQANACSIYLDPLYELAYLLNDYEIEHEILDSTMLE